MHCLTLWCRMAADGDLNLTIEIEVGTFHTAAACTRSVQPSLDASQDLCRDEIVVREHQLQLLHLIEHLDTI